MARRGQRLVTVQLLVTPLFATGAAIVCLPGTAGTASRFLPWLSTGFAVLLASAALGRDRWPRTLTRATDAITKPIFVPLEELHSGLVGDYVMWVMVGLAAFTAATLLR